MHNDNVEVCYLMIMEFFSILASRELFKLLHTNRCGLHLNHHFETLDCAIMSVISYNFMLGHFVFPGSVQYAEYFHAFHFHRDKELHPGIWVYIFYEN